MPFRTAVPEQTLSSRVSGGLPWWTWIAPLPFFHLGTWASLHFQIAPGTSLWYLPISIALVFVLWWGPRVLPALWLNATLCAGLWGLPKWWLWPVYALPETIEVFLVWLFFARWAHGRCSLPNLSHSVRFVLFGLLLPMGIANLYLQAQLVLLGDIPREQFWPLFGSGMVCDLLGGITVSVPLLVFFTPWMERHALARPTGAQVPRLIPEDRSRRGVAIELACIAGGVMLLSTLAPVTDAWFVFGLLALWTAIRFGLGIALLMSSWVVFSTLLLPATGIIDLDLGHGYEPVKVQLAIGVLCLAALITGRAISNLQDEIISRRQLNEELERRVRERTAELESFSYTVSHDLRAPLRAIEGFGAALVEDEGDRLGPDGTRHLQRIRGATARMNDLIEGLIGLARLGRAHLAPTTVDVTAIAQGVVAELRDGDPMRKVTVEIAPGMTIHADASLLRVAMQNLIGNAWKYTRNVIEARIWVTPCTLEGHAGIEVRDNGAGFDMLYAERLFKPFHRLHTEREFEGSGIGLAGVARIVQRHGGTIRAEGSPGNGATFRFTMG